ncbi:MAG: IclR family transcriptional regulator [Treponema sp.]|jgi:DNA-binding IclR family transcriptional regulator|nr:IclR family transcriptional regulator [Treponema sp.]
MIQSVERAIAILRCFEDRDELGVTEISEITGLNKSTAFGLINTLRKEKFLQSDEKTGRLKLGLGLFRLSVNVKLDLKNICAPYINELLQTTKETVNLVIRDEDNVVYIEKKESPYSMRISTRIGQQLPLYCTAVGKAILAFLRDDEIQEYIGRVRLKPFTDKTLKSKKELHEQLIRIRNEGYAYDIEELENGVICVAVPLLSWERIPVGGLSISGPSTRMTPEKRGEIRDLLLALATQINLKI